MERIVQSFKVFWRSERMLRGNELRLTIRKAELTAIAAAVAIFGLMMLSLAAFFALEPMIGKALSALTVAGFDLVFALLLVVIANKLKPSAEVEMLKEVRDLALANIEQEASLANAKLLALHNDVRHFVRHPLDHLLPGVVAPLISGIATGLKSRKAGSEDAPAKE